jgi:hypothetical protein
LDVERTSCRGALGVAQGAHVMDPESQFDLSYGGPPHIRVFFLNTAGELIDPVPGDPITGAGAGCATPPLVLHTPEFEAQAVPSRSFATVSDGRNVSQMRFQITREAVVPAGAAAMGVLFEVRGASRAGFELAVGTVTVERGLAADPNLIPGAAAPGLEPVHGIQPGFGARPDIPRGCNDAAWFSYAQYLAAAAINPAFPETASCYDLFDRD